MCFKLYKHFRIFLLPTTCYWLLTSLHCNWRNLYDFSSLKWGSFYPIHSVRQRVFHSYFRGKCQGCSGSELQTPAKHLAKFTEFFKPSAPLLKFCLTDCSIIENGTCKSPNITAELSIDFSLRVCLCFTYYLGGLVFRYMYVNNSWVFLIERTFH